MVASSRLTIGVDVGTTALKVVALDPARGVVAQAGRPHTLRSPRAGWAEMDPDEWWATTCAALRELLQKVNPGDIACVGVTGMLPAMVLLDEVGQVLRPSIQQSDARSAVEVDELRAAVDAAEFLAITAGSPNQQNIDPRWRWLAKHEPDVVARCATLCGSYDYITSKLTGTPSLEENWAVESGLYNVRQREWHAPYLAHTGIAPSILPPVRQPSNIVGAVTEEAARETGLRPGTPVIAGSADLVAAALASGIATPGDLLLKFGGSGDILYCADRPEPHPNFYFDLHDVPGLALVNGCMASSGSFVRWFADQLGGGATLAQLDREAAATPPGAEGIVVLPYVLGEKTPIFDPLARGIFAGVMLHHTRGHLFRAVLEAVCYGFRHHLELLSVDTYPIRRVVAADGGTRSALWMQIAADITGHELLVVTGEAASALGVAFVAGIAAGLFTSWDEAERFATPGPRYTPRPEHAATYSTGYAVYRELYERLRTLFPRIGAMEGLRGSSTTPAQNADIGCVPRIHRSR